MWKSSELERGYCTIQRLLIRKEVYNQTRKPQIRTANVRPICRPKVRVRAKYKTAKMTT